MDKQSLSHEQLQRELSYRAALSIACRLLDENILTTAEFRRIEQKLRDKFSPVWGGMSRSFA